MPVSLHTGVSYPLRAVSGSAMGSAGVAASSAVVTPVLTALSLTPIAAYSTRRVLTAYTGPLLRVRRSSDDTEQDIGYQTNGSLDVSALATFVGANSGFVTKWYDQSGNTRDMAQANANKQPRIVNAGVNDTISGRVAIFTDGVDDALTTGSFTQAQPLTLANVFQVASTASFSFVNDSITGTANRLGSYFSDSTTYTIFAPTEVAIKTGVAIGDKLNVLETYNGASSSVIVNGTETTGLNPGANGVTGVLIGAHLDAFAYGSHYFGERFIFAGAVSGANKTALAANQKAYWGTP